MLGTFKQKLIIILIIGVATRMFLAAVSFHPDIQAFAFAGYTVSQGKILDLYDFLPNLPPDDPILKSYPVYLFNYPPAIYFFHGVFYSIFQNFVSADFLQVFLFDLPNTFGNWQLYLHLLFLKLPFLLPDLGSAFLLMSLLNSLRNRLLIFSLWMFNPINLYATYLMGQFDIIPTFFIILSLYFIFKNTRVVFISAPVLAAISLGLGTAFKIYPLFLAIPLASVTESWRERIKIIVLGPLVYLLTISPFLPSSGFRSSALLANQSLKSFYAQIPISGGESILLFLAALIFVYLLFLSVKIGPALLWQRYFIILLLFFIFTHTHPQWFLWLIPFFIFDLIQSNFKHWPVISLAVASFTGLLFFFDPSLTLGLFAPLAPSLYNTQSIWQILHLNPDVNMFRSLLQTVFVGSALYLIYRYFPKYKQMA